MPRSSPLTQVDVDRIRTRINEFRAARAEEASQSDDGNDSTDSKEIGARMFGRTSDLSTDARRMFGSDLDHIGRRMFGR